MSYQSEKLSTARSYLMLPHPRGEAESIANAFHECSLALDDLDLAKLPTDTKASVDKLLAIMDTTGLDDPNDEGTYTVKAVASAL